MSQPASSTRHNRATTRIGPDPLARSPYCPIRCGTASTATRGAFAAVNERAASHVVARATGRAGIGAAQQFRPVAADGGALRHFLACLPVGRELAGPRPAD